MGQCINLQLNEWTRHIRQVCGEFEAVFNQQSNLFIGEILSYLIGKTEVAYIKSNAHYIARKQGIPDRVRERFCFLVLQNSGSMQIRHQGRSFELKEGDIALLDPEETIEMFPQGLFSHISVHLSREKLIKQGVSQQHMGKINTCNMSGHLIKTLLHAISTDSVQLWNASDDGEAFEDALIALIKPNHLYQEQPVAKDQCLIAAERYILEHLADCDLSAEKIARHVAVSLRHLYRLFAQQNITIQQYIMQQRLTQIKRQLTDASYQHQSITQIAMRWGFQDSAHFSKKFRQQYGLSPTAYKHQFYQQHRSVTSSATGRIKPS